MAGTFEIIRDGEGAFLFRLRAGDGTLVAISPTFTTIEAAVEGIEAVRENAAMGLIVNHSSAPRLAREEHAGPERQAALAA